MNEQALLNLSNRMQNELFIGFIGSCRAGKSTLINSFIKLLILPNITDEFLKHKILDELPQTAEGKQIMTVEPKFIPSTTMELNIEDTIMNIRFVDCVGEIIPNAEGYGTSIEPRLVKTPWYDEPIPFKDAASIGTEKVIYHHSNLGIYVTSDGSFTDFTRKDYEEIEEKLIPKLKQIDKPFVIVLNTKDPSSSNSIKLAKEIEEKYGVSVICLSALNLTKEDAEKIILKALEEFPIKDLEIMLPDYLNALGDDISLKNEIMDSIRTVEMKYTKIKDVKSICNELEETKQFSSVNLELLDPSSGDAKIILNLDDNKYNEIVNFLLGDAINTRKDFISYLYRSKNANTIYEDINGAIVEAKENGYGVSIPKIKDMKLIPPEVVKRNGLYGVKLAAKATCIHMIAVDVEASFTPIIGSLDQSNMLMNSLKENGNDEEIWDKEFFGKKLSEIVNDSMKSKIISLPDKSKDKIKNVLERIMNTNHNNLIAIII